MKNDLVVQLKVQTFLEPEPLVAKIAYKSGIVFLYENKKITNATFKIDDDNTPDNKQDLEVKGDFLLYIRNIKYEKGENDTKKALYSGYFAIVKLSIRNSTDQNERYFVYDKKLISVFEQMKNLDVSESDIEQNSVEMRKEWSYDRGTRSLTGYVVCQSFAIKTSSRSTAAAVVASLSAEMDVEINHTSAALKNQDSLKNEAIHAVGKKALDKAASYAESVGGKLGRVITVGGDDYGDASVVYGHTVLGARKSLAYGDAMGADVSAVADSVEISASVRLVVELLQ